MTSRGPSLFGFAYTNSALRFLEAIPTSKIRRQVNQKIESLAADPAPPKCKKLNGVTDGGNPVYRVRSGDYRILYAVRGIIIVVLDIDHRKDVYR